MSTLLALLVSPGDLRPQDSVYASWQLFNMCFGDIHLRLLFGLIQAAPTVELDAQLERVVEDYLFLYGTAGRGGA